YVQKERWADALADLRKSRDLNSGVRDFSFLQIWFVRTQLGERTAADQELEDSFSKRSTANTWPANWQNAREWPETIAKFLLGKITEAELLDAVPSPSLGPKGTTDETKTADWKSQGWFYIAVKHLLDGDKQTARADFQKCVAGKGAFREQDIA